jgi:hypothetical protein
LTKIISKKSNCEKHKQVLKEYYLEKFDINNNEHKRLLIQLWTDLKGNEKIDFVDKKWRNPLIIFIIQWI